MQVDCLRLDFLHDDRTGLPTYSIAIIGLSRREVEDNAVSIVARLRMRPYRRTWVSAPDIPEDDDEMEDLTESEAEDAG